MNGRSVRGVEGYTRWSLISLAVGEPVLLWLLLHTLHDGGSALAGPGVAVLAVLVLAHTAACIHAMIAALRRVDPDRGRRGLLPLAATTAAVLVAVVVVLPLDGPAEPVLASIPRASAVAVIGLATIGALSARWPMRILAALTVVVLALVTLTQLGSRIGGIIYLLPAYALVLVSMIASFRLTVWLLEVVRELEVSRESHASLAVAEERLRIARDIHDVVGRGLSVVAVKSELAATLASRGDERAEREMREVRQVAQDSLEQVRTLVSGYRATDLGTELAGARAVLDATGIRVTVTGSADGASPAAQDALGAVVREAVTNVVRHARATWCTLELGAPGGRGAPGVEDGEWCLVVANDGSRGDGAGPGTGVDAVVPGNGLRGLAERLTPLGGTLTTTRSDGVFTLTASVPSRETA
ncbi:sensor histidine kinase [Serinibacter arcticus]|nr:histidine kinase [Serinibacter arcticus]